MKVNSKVNSKVDSKVDSRVDIIVDSKRVKSAFAFFLFLICLKQYQLLS